MTIRFAVCAAVLAVALANASPVRAEGASGCIQHGEPADVIKACTVIIENKGTARADLYRALHWRATAVIHHSLSDLDTPQEEIRKAELAAIADYTRMIEIDPDGFEGYWGRGNVLWSMGRFEPDIHRAILDKAFADLATAVRLAPNPKRPQLYQQRGMMYSAVGENERALEDYTTAIKLSEKPHPNYYRDCFDTYLSLRRYDLAIADLHTFIALKPDKYVSSIVRDWARDALQRTDISPAQRRAFEAAMKTLETLSQ